MKARILLLLVLQGLTGCVSVATVGPGHNVVGQRLTVTLTDAWNQVNRPGSGPAETWTMEGITVDQMLIYPGIREGQPIHARNGSGTRKNLEFRSGMQADEIATLFGGMLTRDGSAFDLKKLEPVMFGGIKGMRFEYDLIRRSDHVRLAGIGYAAVSRGELFALLYMAPRLGFFPRYATSVKKIASEVRITD